MTSISERVGRFVVNHPMPTRHITKKAGVADVLPYNWKSRRWGGNMELAEAMLNVIGYRLAIVPMNGLPLEVDEIQ